MHLTLHLTHACNLRCGYCAFATPGDDAGSMPLRVAVGAVDWVAERARDAGRATLYVHFFGGEPFCAPDVVDVAVHRARARGAELGLRPRFEVATNGCFDEERCLFVADYFDSVVLSIGPRDYTRFQPLPAMSLTSADISRIANLARLELRPAESDRMLERINGFFDIVEQMRAVDTTGVEPLSHPTMAAVSGAAALRLREDLASEPDQREANQQSAPAVERGLFLVPKVIE